MSYPPRRRSRKFCAFSILAFVLAAATGHQPLEAQEEEEEKGGFFSRVKRSLSSVDVSPAEGNIVLITMEDVNRPYELVAALPAVAMQEWGGSSSRRPGGGLSDPGLTSITRALQSLQKIAEQRGADAVIGVRLDFEGPVDGEEGRAVAYGTLIRFVENTSDSAGVGSLAPSEIEQGVEQDG